MSAGIPATLNLIQDSTKGCQIAADICGLLGTMLQAKPPLERREEGASPQRDLKLDKMVQVKLLLPCPQRPLILSE